MAGTVGELKISLVCNTASFTGGMQQAAGTGKKTAQDIHDAFSRVDFSEAKGSLALFGEEIGVGIPRHLQTALASIPGFSTALAAAFPLAAGIAFIDVLGKGVEKIEEYSHKAEDVARTNVSVASSWQDAGEHIRSEIDRQHEKIIGLTQGPIAAMEFAINHLGTSAVAAFRTITAELEKSEGALNKQKGLFNAFGTASDDLKNFQSELDEAIHKAEALAPTDPFAGYSKGIELAQQKLAAVQQRIKDLSTGNAAAKIPALQGADLERMSAPWLKEAEAIQGTIAILNQYKTLQTATIAADNLDLGAKRIEEVNKAWTAEKSVLDARTKETMAGYELQFAEGKISTAQLSALNQTALDSQYAAEVAHFDKLKILDANRPVELKRVLAEEAVAQAQHDTAIITSTAKVLEANQKGLADVEKFNAEFNNKQIADTQRTTDAVVKTIEAANKKRLADFDLIQGEGLKKVAAIDAEINNLKRLIDTYHLTGTAADSVYSAIHQLSVQRQADIAKELLASGKLGDAFHGTLLQMAQDGAQWQSKLAGQFKQTVDGMNSNLASFVATGKADWASLATSAIEGIVMTGLQYAESKAAMALIDAVFGTTKGAQNVAQATSNVALAGTEALASVPWPFNIAAAAETEGAGAALVAQASVGMFAGGGEVPGFGTGDTFHAMLTPREMVLPVDLADVVRNAARSGGGGSNGNGSRPVSMTTHIHALAASADEITSVLEPHIKKVLRSEIRKGYHAFKG